MLDIDPFLGDQIRVGGLGGLGGMPPPEPPAPPKPMPFFDLVGQAEGTDKGRGYNETLGYGKFTGGDVDITNMTVADVLRLQQGMLNHPQNNFNSSAVGRYQVVGQTLRDAVQNGVLKPGDKFDQEAQQKVATFLAQRRGADVTGLRSEWAGLKNVPDEQIMAAYNQQFGQPAAASSAPTDMRSRSFTGYAQQKQAEQSNPANLVALTNQGAVRNLPITETLQSGIASAVQEVYGPGFQARVYSGGQPRPGEGRRVGSTRHDDGNAADVYIYDPEGKRVTGDGLAPLAAYWIKNNRGGVGLEMRGGGIHLDTHTDRAPFWTYGALTPGQQRAVQEAMAARGQGGTTATAFAPQQPQARAETMPASFGRALGGVAVRSPMAERIAASAENPGASAMPERPVQVASADPRAVPVAGPRSSPAQSSMPVQGQPPMMEDYARGPDNGVMAFLQMQAAGTGDNSPTIGGLGGLGGMRMPQPSAAPAPGPSGPPQGQQSPIPAQGQPAPQQQPSIDDFLARAIPRVVPNPWALGGRALAENQAAEAQRQERIMTARALIEKGVNPREAIAATANPQAMTQLMTQRRHDEEMALKRQEFDYRRTQGDQTNDKKNLADENASRAQRGLPPLSMLEFKTQIAQASRPSVNVDQRAENSESKGRGEGLAKRMNDLADDGNKAGEDAVFFQRFGDVLSTVKTGKATETLEKVRQLTGLTLDPNTDNVQALNAMIQYAAPRLRVPGSGAQSDRELSNFLASIPSLAGTPEGNKQILDTLKGIVDYRKQRAAIAQEWQLGEISAKEASERINKLPSPFVPVKPSAPAGGLSSGNAPPAPSETPASTIPDASTLPRIYTREQFDKLKPGDYFIDATGKNIRQKPGVQ